MIATAHKSKTSDIRDQGVILATSFWLCREHEFCQDQYQVLLKALGPDWLDDAPIPLASLLDIDDSSWEGLDNVFWAFQAVLPGQEKAADRTARLFACDCADRVINNWEAQYPKDKSPLQAIEVSRRYALGKATEDELAAAKAAASDAAYAADAAEDARYAAWKAASDAARDAANAAEAAACKAASDAARDAANAARAAAWNAANAANAVRAAAWAAMYSARAAAGEAARAAAWDSSEAARAAAEAVRDAARDAARDASEAARDAAWNTEIRWQRAKLKEHLAGGCDR